MRRASLLATLCVLASLFPATRACAGWPPALISKSNVEVSYAFAIDAQGQMFGVTAAERGATVVVKYSASGVQMALILTGGDGSFRAAEGIALDPEGRVYVADTYASRIQVFDNNLDPLATWSRPGWIEYPRDIEVGADGRVYVKTMVEMQILDRDGEPITRWPAAGSAFSIEPSGNIVTCEQGVFHRYAPDGTHLGDFAGTRSFVYPTGILAYENILLVAAGGGSVFAFDENGVYRDQFYPEGGARLLAKGPRGEIYVDGLTYYQAPGTQLPPPPPPPPPSPSSAVMLHISPVKDPSTSCFEGPSSTDEIVTEAVARQDGTALYSVYLLATPRTIGEGLKGVQLGIEHTGATGPNSSLRIFTWHTCSDAEWPTDTWPSSEAGNTLTWLTCRFDPILAVGAFQVSAYAPASMALAGYPATGVVKTANCDAAEHVTNETLGFDRVGWVSMGGAARGLDRNGCNPALESCLQSPVLARPTTWGRVKSLYGNH